MRLNKVLYGMVQASYLFWRDLTLVIEELGFEVNPYNWCIENKMVNGAQCTITWHVDNLKILCVNKDAIDEVVCALDKRYGSFKPLTINNSKVHDYLRMTLGYTKREKVLVSMYKYIDQLLDKCPPDVDGTAVTRAANSLFEVRDDTEKVNEAKKKLLHQIIAKLLYLSKQARPDVQTAIAFLTNREPEPTMEDYKKVVRV